MEKEKIRQEILHNLLYPKKLHLSILLSEISPSEFMLIALLINYRKEHGRDIMVNELAQGLGVNLSGVSRSLRRLEERGLVKRVCDETCRRNTFAIISESGLELYKGNKKAIENMVDKLLDELSMEEIVQSIEFNKKVSAIVERECEIFSRTSEGE